MTTQIYVLLIYVVITFIGRLLAQGKGSRKRSHSSQREVIMKDWTALLATFAVIFATALPVLEALLRATSTVNSYGLIVGIIIVMVGYSIAYSAQRTIGENWSPTIAKTRDQQLVTSGMYAIVRHPLYLSWLVVIVGTNVYFASSWAWLGVLLVAVVFSIRIPIEERYLVNRFGEEYIAYQKRSKVILPWVL